LRNYPSAIVFSWQTIRDSSTDRLRGLRSGGPLQMLVGGLLLFILLIVVLIPAVLIGAVAVVVMLIRGGLRLLFGSAAAVLPRNDGRRNVRVRRIGPGGAGSDGTAT